MTDFNEATWLRSSFCASGACLKASRAGRLVLVRDSKQPEPSAGGVIQQWARDEWVDLLNAIKRHDVHHPAVDWLTSYQAGEIEFGLHRHEKLTFTGAEWDAFIAGVEAGEFKYELLPTYASTLPSPAPSGGYDAGLAQVGPDFGTRSDQVVTGAGAIAVPPVPVTAAWDPTSPQHAVIRAAIAWRKGIPAVLKLPPDADDLALIEAVDALPHIGETAGTFILSRDAIVELVVRYGDARVVAAVVDSPRSEEAAQNAAVDLLDAIRGALTPIPNVEPEPAWGSGPLVEHVLETPEHNAEPLHIRQIGSARHNLCGEHGGEARPLGYATCPACLTVLRAAETAGTGSADPDGQLLPRRKRSGAL